MSRDQIQQFNAIEDALRAALAGEDEAAVDVLSTAGQPPRKKHRPDHPGHKITTVLNARPACGTGANVFLSITVATVSQLEADLAVDRELRRLKLRDPVVIKVIKS